MLELLSLALPLFFLAPRCNVWQSGEIHDTPGSLGVGPLVLIQGRSHVRWACRALEGICGKGSKVECIHWGTVKINTLGEAATFVTP